MVRISPPPLGIKTMAALSHVNLSDLIALAAKSRKTVKKIPEGVKAVKVNDSQWNKLVMDSCGEDSKAMVKARKSYDKRAKRITKKIAKSHVVAEYEVNAKVQKRA